MQIGLPRFLVTLAEMVPRQDQQVIQVHDMIEWHAYTRTRG
jgi:hypothetical protein